MHKLKKENTNMTQAEIIKDNYEKTIKILKNGFREISPAEFLENLGVDFDFCTCGKSYCLTCKGSPDHSIIIKFPEDGSTLFISNPFQIKFPGSMRAYKALTKKQIKSWKSVLAKMYGPSFASLLPDDEVERIKNNMQYRLDEIEMKRREDKDEEKRK